MRKTEKLLQAIVAAGWMVMLHAGCSKEEPVASVPEGPVVSDGASGISLTTGAVKGGQDASQPSAPTGPVPVVPVEFSDSAPPEKQIAAVVESANAAYFGAEGAATVPKDGVELLNRAIQVYGERRQETDDGDGPQWPVISSLDQLVRYRILKALPAAPAGKKYTMNPTTKVVTLEDR